VEGSGGGHASGRGPCGWWLVLGRGGPPGPGAQQSKCFEAGVTGHSYTTVGGDASGDGLMGRLVEDGGGRGARHRWRAGPRDAWLILIHVIYAASGFEISSSCLFLLGIEAIYTTTPTHPHTPPSGERVCWVLGVLGAGRRGHGHALGALQGRGPCSAWDSALPTARFSRPLRASSARSALRRPASSTLARPRLDRRPASVDASPAAPAAPFLPGLPSPSSPSPPPPSPHPSA
jgi:hypothetical protein